MIFSAAGAFVAAAFGLTGAAVTIAGIGLSLGGALVASVVAAGLATVASRLINGGGAEGAGGTTQDPGVRQQLPPATDNKVPVVYGTAHTKGTVTDARITSDNQTMTYVLALSEKTQTGTFTVGDIFWNDQLLTFGTGADTYKVVSSRDQNGLGTTSTNYAGLIEMRVYAGSAQNSANQIFPTTNKVTAASYIGETTSTYLLSDLVYAVVKITYSAEKNVTALQQMTFEVQNSLSNPGSVLYDYLTSPRYGAGIPEGQIDAFSMTSSTPGVPSLFNISNEIPPNQFNSNGSTSTQARYVINGVISTGDTVKNNFEKITQASASWLTYDFGQGKWKVIPNRPLSSGELSALDVYDDDSIMGEITLNATNLEDLYNSIEVEFASNEIRDQNDFYRASIADSERNDLEPDNKLSLRFDLINNSIHAQRLGLIELQQSRVDKTIQFRTDYSGLKTQAGDVIKITNEVYGFTEKLFRVTRVREMEDDRGSLMAEISGLEYDADVYSDSSITAYQPNTASGIPSFGGPVALPAPGTVAIVSQSPTANQPTFRVSTVIPATSGPVDRILWYYTTTPTVDGTGAVYITDEVGPFSGGQTVTEDLFALTSGTYYLLARSQRAGNISAFSDAGQSPPPGPFTYSTRIDWNPRPAGASNGTINTSTFSSQLNILTTSTGAGFIPIVSATSGFQPVYADADLTFTAAPNTLGISGQGASINFVNTGTRITSPQSVAGPLLVQNNATNGVSYIGIAPSGTGTTGGVSTYGSSDIADSQTFRWGTTANTEAFLNVTRNGTARPFVPLNMYVAGRQVFSANTTTGQVTIANGVQTTSLGYNTGTTTISHTLQRQASQPAYFITGTMAVANGASWNPTQEPTGGPAYLTYYNGAEWRAIGQPAVFGQFYSTGTSSISTVTEAQLIPLGNTGVSYGIFNTTATAITLNGPGVYNVMFSAQFTNSGASAEYAYIWYRQNGVDIADSNSIFSVPAKHGSRDGALIGTVDLYVTTSAAGEYVQLVWGADSTNISIPTVAAGTGPTRPRTPGIIVTVTKVK